MVTPVVMRLTTAVASLVKMVATVPRLWEDLRAPVQMVSHT